MTKDQKHCRHECLIHNYVCNICCPSMPMHVEPAPVEQVIAVSIVFKLPNILDFERQFMDISTPGSPIYGQFL